MTTGSNRELNQGFSDALIRAVELVATPGIFAFLGWLIDRRLGTGPVFALVLGLLVLGYVCWKMWSGYERQMAVHERHLGLGRSSSRGGR